MEILKRKFNFASVRHHHPLSKKFKSRLKIVIANGARLSLYCFPMKNAKYTLRVLQPQTEWQTEIVEIRRFLLYKT